MRQIFLLEDDAALGRGIAMALRGAGGRCDLPGHTGPGPGDPGGGDV